MPSRNAIRVGIEVMPAAPARPCSASVSTLPNTMSGCVSEAASKTGRELPARAAPGRPEVDEHDVVVEDGGLEGAGGQCDGSHGSHPW